MWVLLMSMLYYWIKKIDNEFDREVNSPKKHDNRLHNIIIPKQSITSSKKKLAGGFIELPLSRKL